MNEETANKPHPKGIFVTKGMKFSIQEFSIQIDDNGNFTHDPVVVHTGLDMTPYWLNIAFNHLLSTEIAHNSLIIANDRNDAESIAKCLEFEFTSGMQSIMSSAIAMDAYYSSIKDNIFIPEELIIKWRANKVARYKQISEVLRRAFKLNNNSTKNIRSALMNCFQYRDMAVHPSCATSRPVLYPEINKISDWRYAAFRFHNAKILYGATLSIIFQTASKKMNGENEKLVNHCKKSLPDLELILDQWTERFGKLF